MKRWHQFSDGLSTKYGYGTVDQARRYLAGLNAPRAVNHYVATELDEGEEPVAEGLTVDLNNGLTLPTRYKLRQSPQTE